MGVGQFYLQPYDQMDTEVPAPNEISGFRLEERIFVADFDELAIARTALVSDAGQMGIALLAVFSHHLWESMSIANE